MTTDEAKALENATSLWRTPGDGRIEDVAWVGMVPGLVKSGEICAVSDTGRTSYPIVALSTLHTTRERALDTAIAGLAESIAKADRRTARLRTRLADLQRERREGGTF